MKVKLAIYRKNLKAFCGEIGGFGPVLKGRDVEVFGW
jgi:hypothetical protein